MSSELLWANRAETDEPYSVQHESVHTLITYRHVYLSSGILVPVISQFIHTEVPEFGLEFMKVLDFSLVTLYMPKSLFRQVSFLTRC